jgi:hypothetical protein
MKISLFSLSIFFFHFFFSSSHHLSAPSLQNSLRSFLAAFGSSSFHVTPLSLESQYVTITGISIEKIKIDIEKTSIFYDSNLKPPSLVLNFEAEEAEFTVNLKYYPNIPIIAKKFKLDMLLTILPNSENSGSHRINMELGDIELNLNYVLKKVLPKIDIHYANRELKKLQIPINNQINIIMKKNYEKFFSFLKNEEYKDYDLPGIINSIGHPFRFDNDSKSIILDGEWIINKNKVKKEDL